MPAAPLAAEVAGTDDAEMMEWIAAMTADPSLSSLLEPIVSHPIGQDPSPGSGVPDHDAHRPDATATRGHEGLQGTETQLRSCEARTPAGKLQACLLDSTGNPTQHLAAISPTHAAAPMTGTPDAEESLWPKPPLQPKHASSHVSALLGQDGTGKVEMLPGGVALEDFLDDLDYGEG